MNTVIIPQHIANKGDLVILPRKEYEVLFRDSAQAKADWVYEKPVSEYLRARMRATESEFKNGKAVKWQSGK